MSYVFNSKTLRYYYEKNGECRQMAHKDFRAKTSITMGICGGYNQPPLNGANCNGIKGTAALHLIPRVKHM